MSDYDRGVLRGGPVAAGDMSVDVGLRAFMLGVYNKVALGLVLSAALAWVTGTVPAVRQLLWSTNEYGRRGFTILGHDRRLRAPSASSCSSRASPAARSPESARPSPTGPSSR